MYQQPKYTLNNFEAKDVITASTPIVGVKNLSGTDSTRLTVDGTVQKTLNAYKGISSFAKFLNK